MMTDNIDTCDICCINSVSVADIRFSCKECKKSVCKSCYNKTRTEWNRDSGELGVLKERNNNWSYSIASEVLLEEVKTIEDADYPIRCKYRCPYCRYDNYKNYEELTKEELLLFMKKDYLHTQKLKKQYHNDLQRMLSLNEENDKLKIINEELTYCDGTSRSDNDSRLQLKIDLAEYQRDKANKELINLASNFNRMMDILVNNNNIIADKEQSLLELKNIRNKNKEIEETYNQKLQSINNIIGNKLPKKKAVETLGKIKEIINNRQRTETQTISFTIEYALTNNQ